MVMEALEDEWVKSKYLSYVQPKQIRHCSYHLFSKPLGGHRATPDCTTVCNLMQFAIMQLNAISCYMLEGFTSSETGEIKQSDEVAM